MASALSRKTPGSGRSLNADKIMPFKTPSEREPLLNSAPEDRCQLAYVIFFLHGIGHLLPWNFFITAQPVSLSLPPWQTASNAATSVVSPVLQDEVYLSPWKPFRALWGVY